MFRDHYQQYIPTRPSQGWQCPLCKVVYAYWVYKCECAKAEPAITTIITEWPTVIDGTKELEKKE